MRAAFRRLELSTFAITLLFYSSLWIINPQNKIIVISFFVLILVFFLKNRDIRVSLLLGYLASLVILTGKTYVVQLVPPGIFPIDQWPFGYIRHIVVTPTHVISAIMVLIMLRDVLKKHPTERRMYAQDMYIFLFYLWMIASSLFASVNPEISVVFTILLLHTPIVYLYIRFNASRWTNMAYAQFIGVLLAIVVFESGVSIMQFVNSSPVGKNIETQVGIEQFGEAVDELAFRFRPVGTLEHANDLAQMLTFYFPIILSLYFARLKMRYLFVSILVTLTLAMTLSRSAWIGYILSIFILLYCYEKIQKKKLLTLNRKYLLLIVVLAILSVMYFVFPRLERSVNVFSEFGGGAYVRGLQTEATIELILRSPLLGVGALMSVPESLMTGAGRIFSEFPSPIHNAYLLYSAEYGIPSIVFILLFVLLCLRYLIKAFVSRGTKESPLAMGVAVGSVSLLVVAFFQPTLNEHLMIPWFALVCFRPYGYTKNA